MATKGVILALAALFGVAAGDLGVVHAESGDGSHSVDFCIGFYPQFHALPTALDRLTPHLLQDLYPQSGCAGAYSGQKVAGKTVAVRGGNCSLTEKALLAQQNRIFALLVIGLDNNSMPLANFSLGVNITVAVMRAEHYASLAELGRDTKTWLYQPEIPHLDPSMAVFLVLAVLCVVAGALWAGEDSRAGKKGRRRRRREGSEEGGGEEEGEEDEGEKKEDNLELTLPAAIILVFLLCAMLLLLYFFYDYLVYVIIGIFCLACTLGLHSCLLPVWRRVLPCTTRVPLPKCQPELRSLLLLLLCAALTIFWAVERKASYAWVLQDLLGVAFSINMIRTVRLPNLKTCTILLSLLFLYDIFFVFITPLFTKNGDSIMVRVATGGKGSTEQLPMVFTVPKFLPGPFAVCGVGNSLLGFGDVLVPGLLIAHNNCFDLKVGSTCRVYFLASVLGYLFSLALTFVGVILMEQGQPALMYIVPVTLTLTYIIACKRGELHHMFTGKGCPKKDDDVRSGRCTPPGGVSEGVSATVINDELRTPLLESQSS